jgi:eukaryotic-like serine/threonine-protein kinase
MGNDTQFESLNLEELRDHPNRLSPAQRIALVRADQRRAWAAGDRAMVEDLLKRYSALAHDAEAIIDLAYSEFMLRTEAGEKVDTEEYARRFPDQAPALRRQLALHLALQQMTFTSVQTLSKDGNSSKTIHTGPPVFASLPPATPPVLVSEAAQAFQTLMQSPGSTAQSTPTLTPEPEGDISVPGYEILSELGRGGMGVVYKARQHRLDRVVALKMILSGEFASKNDRARFREEAVKLARVQHQNIVQIYEVSEHDNRPYFAMEYLDGGSLAKEISGQPLTPRIAARLILSLANAMFAAHEKGIVHRDLKPGNILLTAGGLHEASERGLSLHMSVKSNKDLERGPIAKITDFGLAKGLQGEESKTVSGAILGTPSYMAPEQARGQSKSVGPSADIYALGAILYECLTGRPPFLAPNAIDTIYLVVHEEPVKPSAWSPKLPQDLETICLKCLEKVPEKRYSTAKALAEDLEAFLDNRPIKARPVGLVERAVKWAKRRPAQAALAGTVVLAALTLLATGVWFTEQVRRQRDRAIEAEGQALIAKGEAEDNAEKFKQQKLIAEAAEQVAKTNETKARNAEAQTRIALDDTKKAKDAEEAAKITAVGERKQAQENEKLANKMFGFARDAVNEYFTSVSQETLLDEPGMEGLRKTLLEQASKFYTKFADERKNDPSVRAELAAALGRLGKIRAAIDLRSEGIDLYRQALELYKKLDAEKPGDMGIEASLSETHFELGVLYRDTNRETEAVAYGQQAVDRWDALACRQPENEQFQAELARSLNGLGGTYAEFKRYDLARGPLDRALSIRKMLVEAHPDADVLLRDLSVTYDNIATVAESRNENQTAELAHKDALAISERLVKKNAERLLYRNDLGRYFLNLGNLYLSTGDFKLAADSLSQAAENWGDLARTHPKVKQFRFSAAKANRILADALFRLAQTSDPQNRQADAKQALKKARDLIQMLVQEEPDDLNYMAELALVDSVDGDQLRFLRLFPEAVEAYRKCVNNFDSLLKKSDDLQYKRALANALLQLGVCMQAIATPADTRGVRMAEAMQALDRSSVLWKELVETDPQNIRYRRLGIECLVEFARLKLEAEDPKSALPAADDAVKLGAPFKPDPKLALRERTAVQRAYWRRAQALSALGRFEEALAAWDGALAYEENKDASFYNLYGWATLARTPQFGEAVQKAATYSQRNPNNGRVHYEVARIHALAAHTAGGDLNDDKTPAGKMVATALKELRDARNLMAKTDPQIRSVLATDRDWAELATGKDWDALRQRDDFKKLLGEIKSGRSP